MKKLYSRFYIVTILFLSIILFAQCRRDDDMNFRIVIENYCDFPVKAYYDNQDIEYYEDGDRDVTVVGSVSFVPANGEKVVYSKYRYVWIETSTNPVMSRKFRSDNDGPFKKRIEVYPEDFYGY